MAATSAEARSQIVALVRDFVRREVEPVAAELDREDRVPHDLIDQMKELGLFGITVPEEYGGLGLDYTTFASIFEELSMGLMSLTGAIGTHHILTYVLTHYGTEEQRERFLPDLASGRKRGGPGPDRAGRRHRRGQPADHGHQGRRGIYHQRLQDVHHQRAVRGYVLPAGPHRPGHGAAPPWAERLRDGARRAGIRFRGGPGTWTSWATAVWTRSS